MNNFLNSYFANNICMRYNFYMVKKWGEIL